MAEQTQKEKEKIREKLKRQREKAKNSVAHLHRETRHQAVTAMIAAFGFIIALVWKDVIQGWVDFLVKKFSFGWAPALSLLYAAIITTIIAVIGIVIVSRWNYKKEEDEK